MTHNHLTSEIEKIGGEKEGEGVRDWQSTDVIYLRMVGKTTGIL